MTKTLCQFVGEDGPAHPEMWLPGPPRDYVSTPVFLDATAAVLGLPDRPTFEVEEWRLKTVMPTGDDFVALYQFDRRWP